jgi:hypothetical protein
MLYRGFGYIGALEEDSNELLTNLFPLILLYGLKSGFTSSPRKSSRPGPFAKLSFCSFESVLSARLLQQRCFAMLCNK